MTIKETNDWHEGVVNAISDLKKERRSQLHKWGPQNHSWGKWSMILSEEVGEMNKAILEGFITCEMLSFTSRDKAYAEAIQVAAVALAIAQLLKTGEPV